MKVTKHIIVFGRVQGVYFRASLQQEGRRLKVTGWVRNRLDGSVEAMLQGPPTAVDALIAWARRGPTDAHVHQITIDAGFGEYDNFAQLPTI